MRVRVGFSRTTVGSMSLLFVSLSFVAPSFVGKGAGAFRFPVFAKKRESVATPTNSF